MKTDYFNLISNPTKPILFLVVLTILTGFSFPVPQIPFAPKTYVCYWTADSINVDGKLDERVWQTCPWTDRFVDIEGGSKPSPRFITRVKMRWDSLYFYIAAELFEPDVWATLTERDAIIFYDNDFEVFIDPDGDTHEYYELEINALNTVWDLFLVKPYRDGGPALHAWDIAGLKTAVQVKGTINTPGDKDQIWSVEIALPWKILKEAAHRPAPPVPGDVWRVNFSRVEWQIDSVGGKYVKSLDQVTKNPLAGDNWVWSPQGLVNMHYPEMWGMVKFSDRTPWRDSLTLTADDIARWNLRRVYYQEWNFFEKKGAFSDDAGLPGLEMNPKPWIEVMPGYFEASLPAQDGWSLIRINSSGRVWTGPGLKR